MSEEANESLRVNMKVDVTNVYVLSGIEDLVKKQKEAKSGFEQMQDASKKMTDAIGKGLKKASDGLKNMVGGFGDMFSGILGASGISLGMDSVVSSMKDGFENLKGTSEEYAGTMKSLEDAQGQLGESLAGAFAPAIELLVPLLVEATDFLSLAADAFGDFLSGFLEDNGNGLMQFKDNMVQMVSEINWASLLESLKGLWESLQPFAEAIGAGLSDLWNNVLVPMAAWVIGDGLPALLDFISGIVSNEMAMSILQGIAIAIGSIAAAALIYNGIMTIATAVTGAFGAVIAFLSSPVGIIILAIGALIAVGVLLYKNWETVCQYISNIWNNIIGIITFAVEIVKASISNSIETVKSIITVALNIIQTVWDNIMEHLSGKTKMIFEGIWFVIKFIINSIIGGIETMANGIINGVNMVIRALNCLNFEIPDWIPGLGGKTFGFNIDEMHHVTFPRLATGGIVTRPATALIGEAGREAILPLEHNTGWMDVLADRLAARMPGGAAGPVYLQVDGQTFARLELPYMQAEKGRIGINFGSVR